MTFQNFKSTVLFVIAALFFVFLTLMIAYLLKIKRKNQDFIGRLPTDPKLFIFGKTSVMVVFISLILQVFNVNLRWFFQSSIAELIALVLVLIAFIIFIISFLGLGDSLRMGLPEERTTKLKTSGTYRISRNPMYLALNLIMIAAILFTINPVILILAVVAIYTNHRVIVGEEKFLEREFGSEYIKYCKKVRRYI